MCHFPYKTVLITRHREGNDELQKLLQGRVDAVLRWDSFRFAKLPIDWRAKLQQKDWIVFSSAAAVHLFFEDVSPADLAGVQIACVGAKTASAVRQHGVSVSLVPQIESAQGLADEPTFCRVSGLRILLLGPKDGRREFYDALKERHSIDFVQHYAKDFLEMPQSIKDSIQKKNVDLILIFSPQVAKELIEKNKFSTEILARLSFAVIGQSTAAVLREFAITPQFVADEASAQTLVQKIFSPTKAL